MGDSDSIEADRVEKIVVCGVDHSPHAEAVAYTAAGMAMVLGANVVLFRSDRRALGHREEQLSAQGDLEKLALQSIGTPSGHRVKVAIDVKAESPADGIKRHLAASSPLMVLIGSRGRSFLTRSLLGSTALSLIQHTTVPLVIVPPTDPEVFSVSPDGVQCHVGSVLIPVDFSESMEGQLRFASVLLSTERCPVTLLHVARKGESDMHAEELERLRVRLHSGTHLVDTMVLEGDVRHVLGDLLTGDTFGLVVLGRDRHRTGAVASDLLHVSTSLMAVA